MSNQERRRYPRVHDEELSLKLHTNDFDAITHTMNISASGVYCKVNNEIPIMSRVQIVLMVPEMTKSGPVVRNIEVTGVVVRQHPVIIDGQTKHYDMAIFFEDLSPKDRELIADYVARKK